eukprot:705066-Rhodomonas_salina.4
MYPSTKRTIARKQPDTGFFLVTRGYGDCGTGTRVVLLPGYPGTARSRHWWAGSSRTASASGTGSARPGLRVTGSRSARAAARVTRSRALARP